ncbi:hypothetical protein V8F33_013433 [Rhypophila sp. PSN 637]
MLKNRGVGAAKLFLIFVLSYHVRSVEQLPSVLPFRSARSSGQPGNPDGYVPGSVLSYSQWQSPRRGFTASLQLAPTTPDPSTNTRALGYESFWAIPTITGRSGL